MHDLREVRTLIRQAEALPEGPAQVALFETALGIAETHRDDALGYEVRKKMMFSLYGVGCVDQLLVNYAWCLGYVDRDPNRNGQDLLWSYRWVIDVMWKFPEVSRLQIESALADMSRRYREHGYSQRPIQILSRRLFNKLGDRKAAAAAHRTIERHPRDGMSDCRSTESAFHVFHLVWWRKDREAITAGEPFLNGTETEAHFLICTYGRLLLPLARAGRVAEARKLASQSLRLMTSRPRYLGDADDEIRFLSVVGDLGAAVKTCNRHLPARLMKPGRFDRFAICRSARILTERLLRAGKQRSTLRVPTGLIPGLEGDRCPVPQLAEWLDTELQWIAEASDARNGNSFYRDELRRMPEYTRLANRLERDVQATAIEEENL